MGRRPEVARGFTLLELIVTLAVLALAAAVVTPAVGRGTDTLRARAEVAGFAATLRHAREQAIHAQRTHRVTIDAEHHKMEIALAAGEDPPRATRALSPRLTIEALQAPEVVFDARGMASGGDFKLTSGGLVYRVTVDRLTGRVRSVRE
jgi:general secretion pathway protein H